mmetsp:Transcript_6044/g.25299  ORF Transcript_6044/g.25299 Transcript_6044/m.25299 type:complete len:81 (-) Transcript_6044:46-288(-)
MVGRDYRDVEAHSEAVYDDAASSDCIGVRALITLAYFDGDTESPDLANLEIMFMRLDGAWGPSLRLQEGLVMLQHNIDFT